MNDGSGVFLAIIAILGLIVYIFPLALAAHRGCTASAGIAVVNIFLGWTFIGWVVALAWAATGQVKVAGSRQLTEAETQLALKLLAGAQYNNQQNPQA
jgi:cell division septal protein FtsQ